MNKRGSATPGGMWSGCAGSRTFQPADFVSQWTFGVWQGGHRPRWSKPTDRYQTTQSRPSTMAVIRRRFDAGKRNFETAYKHLVDSWAKFDILGQEPILLEWGEN